MKKQIRYKVISAASLLLFLIVWELITDVFRLFPVYSMPSPVQVVKSLVAKLSSPVPDGSTLLQHIGASLYVALCGFLAGAVAGIPCGIVMAWNQKVDFIVRPVFDLLRPIPPIGWIPIMILVLGIGLKAKIAVIFIATFVPCAINAYSGIKQTNPIHLWVAQTFGATRRQLLWKVSIPTALPMIFTGLKTSMNVAWMSLVAAELVAATRGVGYMIQIARTIGRADIIFVGLVVLAIIGTLLMAGLDYIEERFVKGED